MLDFFYNYEDATQLKKIREGLNQNSILLNQAFNYIPVEWFGLSVDNDPSENDTAIIQAVESMKTNKHGLQFGSGSYLFSNQFPVINGSDMFRIRGLGAQTNGVTSPVTIIGFDNFTGTGIKIQGTPSNVHFNLEIKDILISGGNENIDLLDITACSESVLDNVNFRSTKGYCIKAVQWFDSIINNTSYELSGADDGSKSCLQLYGDINIDGTDYLLCNQLYFTENRFETPNGRFIKSDGAAKIFFENCKFESKLSNYQAIEINDGAYIYFNNINALQAGTAGNTIDSIIKFTNTNNVYLNGDVSTNFVHEADFTSLIELDNCKGVDMFLQCDVNAINTLTGDYIINVTNDFTYKNLNLSTNGVITKKLWDGQYSTKLIDEAKMLQSSKGTLEDSKEVIDATNPTIFIERYTPSATDAIYNLIKKVSGVENIMYTIGTNNTLALGIPLNLNDNPLYLGAPASEPAYLGQGNGTGTTYVETDTDTIRQAINGLYRRIGYDTAIPVAGTWKRGDIVYNKVPTAGGYIGWVCLNDGTPGTWKGFGLIEV